MNNIINNIKGINVLLYSENVYSLKIIEKKSKSNREIYIPNNRLKNIQKNIKKQLEIDYDEEIRRMKFQNAYTKNKSIITNAKPHENQKYLIKLDVENYFDSITFQRIYGKLKKKYDEDIALKISQLSCYRIEKKHIALAQGAPTSPIISNIIGQSIDIYFWKKIKRYRSEIKYTRYSDDITLSMNDEEVFNILKNEEFNDFEETGFRLNSGKSKYLKNNQKKIVTGIVVNEKLNVSKKYRSELRNNLRNCKWNVENTIRKYEETYPKSFSNVPSDKKKEKFEMILKGKVEFIATVKGVEDTTYLKYAQLYNKIDDFKYKFDTRNKYEKSIISILYGKDDSPSHGTGFFVDIEGTTGLMTNYHVLEELIKKIERTDYTYKMDFYIKNRLCKDSYLLGYDEKFKLTELTFPLKFLKLIKYSNDLDYCFVPLEVLEEVLEEVLKPKFDKVNFLEIELKTDYDKELEIIGYPQGFDKYTSNKGYIKESKNNDINILNFKVGEGASGSPVLQNGKVIGLYFGEEKIIEKKVENYITGANYLEIMKIVEDMKN